MSQKQKRNRRSFSAEFKQEAVDLVAKQGYSFQAAADAVGIHVGSLRAWYEKLVPEQGKRILSRWYSKDFC